MAGKSDNKQSGTDPDKVAGAFIAYQLSIKSFLGEKFPQEESILDRAKQFGALITDDRHLILISDWFNWEYITAYLRGQK